MKDRNLDFGDGFLGRLTIAFIVLRLIGEISWSWLWVLSPMLIPICLSILWLSINGIVHALTNDKKS